MVVGFGGMMLLFMFDVIGMVLMSGSAGRVFLL